MKKILFLFLVLFLCACKENVSSDVKDGVLEEKEEYVLNERQKEILRKEGLPTEYEELTLSQKAAIEAIENLLVYLEEKYEDTFSYSGYVAQSTVEEEHLIAECSQGTVTVYRRYVDGGWSYEDDYAEVCAVPKYKELIDERVSQYFASGTYKVFVMVNRMTSETQIPFLGASGTSYIFVDESVGKEKFDEFVSEYTEWITESSEGLPTGASIFFTDAGKIENIRVSNYAQMLLKDIFIKEVNYSISVDGNVHISEKER